MADKNKYHLVIAYIGSSYQGWQRQVHPGQEESPTVQQELEKACAKILTEPFHIQGSGRTDSGVHARRQNAHLNATTKLHPDILLKAINAYLPADIRILSLKIKAADFHAQKSATQKTYRYFILNSTTPAAHINWPFLRGYTWFVIQPLDLTKIKKCLMHLKGEHDFKSFQNRGTPVKSTVRRLLAADLIVHPRPSQADFPWDPPAEMAVQLLEIRLTGTGFLKQMVRNIVGTLVEVGQNKTSVEEFKQILENKDRRTSGVTAPARGLFLDSVDY
jgi:tRNA pseudouridine38-40 synthase